jgi:integration host factor subunit alpha
LGKKLGVEALQKVCTNLTTGTPERDTFLLQSVSGMIGKTVTRADLCEAVYRKVGLSRAESATLVELVLKEIIACLERGESVKLSAFGSFVVRKKGQRIGRNPKTGKEVPILPRRVLVFKPSVILKQRISVATGSSAPAKVQLPESPTRGPQEVLAMASGGNVGKSLARARGAVKQHT